MIDIATSFRDLNYLLFFCLFFFDFEVFRRMQSWKYMSRYFLQQNGTPPYRLILAELCLIVWPFEDSTRLVSKIRLEKYTRGYNPGSKSVPCVGRRIFPEAAEDEVPTPSIDVADEKTMLNCVFSATSSFGAEVIFEVGAGFTGSKLSHDTWSRENKANRDTLEIFLTVLLRTSLVIVQCLSKDGK